MMKRLLSFATIALLASSGPAVLAQKDMKPPVAKKVPSVLKIHGYEITDNYAWMRDRNEKKDPEIIKYLEDENAYVEHHMGKHQPFVDSLYKEMLGRIKQTDMSVPVKRGNYWYFTKVEEGKQYPTYLRSKTQDGANPEVLLDQNKMAEGFKYFAIGAFEPSDDGNLLAYSTDTTGYRQYELQVKDLRTGKVLPDKIERVTSLEWSPDGKFLFLGQEDAVSKRSDKIWRHELGTNNTKLIFEEKDVFFNTGVGRSRDKQMYFIASYAKTSTEFRYLPANAVKEGVFSVLSPRREGHEYSADFNNGEFFIRTNKDAENFKVMRVGQEDPSEQYWKDYIPHNPAVKIEGLDFFKDFAVVSELENGLEYLRVMDMKTRRAPMRIPTDESVYTM
ncbi:MAG TPA: oligopeptidase B, partial [Blastocatellia bacterium]|nr:oligopeptidase B [Blastocatellia bacterium]